MTIITNVTTNETKIFDTSNEKDCVDMMIFLRKAVVDYMFEYATADIELDDGTLISVYEDTPEVMRWTFAGMLFCQSVNSGYWLEDIVTMYKIEEVDEDEVD